MVRLGNQEPSLDLVENEKHQCKTRLKTPFILTFKVVLWSNFYLLINFLSVSRRSPRKNKNVYRLPFASICIGNGDI